MQEKEGRRVWRFITAEQAVCDAPRARTTRRRRWLLATRRRLARHGPVLSFPMWSIYGPVNERRCTVSFAELQPLFTHSVSVNSQVGIGDLSDGHCPRIDVLVLCGRIASVKISLGHVDHNWYDWLIA